MRQLAQMLTRGALFVGSCAAACSVDQRQLSLGSSSAGTGASAGNNPGSGGGSSGVKPEGGSDDGPGQQGASGESAMPGGPSQLVDGCADLDTDGVADCTTTLVANPSFKSDVTHWTAAGSATLTWNDKNALNDTPSGCALVSAEGGVIDIDGSVLFRAVQCLKVPAGRLVIAYANAWVEPAMASEEPARGELQVSYFDDEGCAGTPTDSFSTPPNTVAGAWVTLHAGGVTGPATQSVSVELAGAKPYRNSKISVCFDNVMIKTKAP